jgi:hypothetical protein
VAAPPSGPGYQGRRRAKISARDRPAWFAYCGGDPARRKKTLDASVSCGMVKIATASDPAVANPT